MRLNRHYIGRTRENLLARINRLPHHRLVKAHRLLHELAHLEAQLDHVFKEDAEEPLRKPTEPIDAPPFQNGDVVVAKEVGTMATTTPMCVLAVAKSESYAGGWRVKVARRTGTIWLGSSLFRKADTANVIKATEFFNPREAAF